MTVKNISDEEIRARIEFENPWWFEPHQIDEDRRQMRHRAYFELFFQLAVQRSPRRAVILMGPRRVGKTVMLLQTVQKLIDDGVPARTICYLDLQSPIFSGLDLQRLLSIGMSAAGIDKSNEFFMIYDEIQYVRDWEVQLKNAVDSFPKVKFVASGSAAAALRVKSTESGAGRFTDFLLPPVTYYEYLILVGIDKETLITVEECPPPEGEKNDPTTTWYSLNCDRIGEANKHFLNYLNFGGYPEAILSPAIQEDPGRFIRSDIIEKVLMRDIPSLYGITDVTELNRLFTTLAYNTAQEVSLDGLSKGSGVAKQTIKRYIEYLESAFLIKCLQRIDQSAKRFQKANFFKVYLTNPCMRSALFAPLTADSEHIGSLVETAVFAQWLHSDTELHYGRWQNGEVDFIFLDARMFRPTSLVEVKWSDHCIDDFSELKSVRRFHSLHPDCRAYVTSISRSGFRMIDDRKVSFFPAAVYCYYVGAMMIRDKRDKMKIQLQSESC